LQLLGGFDKFGPWIGIFFVSGFPKRCWLVDFVIVSVAGIPVDKQIQDRTVISIDKCN